MKRIVSEEITLNEDFAYDMTVRKTELTDHFNIDTHAAMQVLNLLGVANNGDFVISLRSKPTPGIQAYYERRCAECGSVPTQLLGINRHKGTIHLFTKDRTSEQINHTLLRELFVEGCDGKPQDHTIPYGQRPSLIAANAFADEYASRYMLVSVSSEIPA